MLYREQIDKSRVPAHVAIIMDGNGRWAKQRGQIRSFGTKPVPKLCTSLPKKRHAWESNT